ncbi:MAG TPA: right-handed parallel beta-helix repeat-containing protein [Syntrophobacteraceae bacterium]|nr:right-handed parallel beta-helix repeat-containing protein [Syntrophobacteraceae bacterium]
MLGSIRWIGALVLLSLIWVGSVHAQATRTWVSGVGDDANPCSRTAPCKTFAGAIVKTAASGEIDALDPGGFGTLTITKSITIDGGGNLAGVLVSGANGIVVEAGPSDAVILRNLDIDGLGAGLNGVRFVSGAMLFIENCTIYGFTQNGIDCEPSGTGEMRLSVDRALVRQVSLAGLLVKPSSGFVSATVANSRFEHCGFGARAEGHSKVMITNSIASHNVNEGFGVILPSPSAILNLENCVSSDNTYGLRADGADSVIYISNNYIADNTTAGMLATNGAKVISFGNNCVIDNAATSAPTGSATME